MKEILPSKANIVVLAANYNLSIVSKEWLERKNVFTGIVSNFVYTPVFVLTESDNFNLVVDERRFQLAVKRLTEENLIASVGIVEKFVEALPETPYKSIGLNYHFTFDRNNFKLNTILSCEDDKVRKIFSPTYEIGATIYFEFNKFVVTFVVSTSLRNREQIQVSFNFHSDVENVSDIKERLSNQAATMKKAQEIIKELS